MESQMSLTPRFSEVLATVRSPEPLEQSLYRAQKPLKRLRVLYFVLATPLKQGVNKNAISIRTQRG
jgi:hypothetical protein